MFRSFLYLILFFLLGACAERRLIESSFVKIKVTGEIYQHDWLEVNNYRIEILLPDTTQARAHNNNYNPYFLKVSESDPKVGYVSPSKTYDGGPERPFDKNVTKGMMLYNLGKMLTIMSYAEFDSSIFDFKTDKITAFNGLLILGMVNGEPLKIMYPQGMNISVEPYELKK